MAERVYSHDEVMAAMCIWEEMSQPKLPDAPQPWTDYSGKWGVYGLRDVVIEKLAGACDAAWTRARHRHEAAYQATGEGPETAPDPGSFDWDFVPLWIRECVDWSGEHPRVKGSQA